MYLKLRIFAKIIEMTLNNIFVQKLPLFNFSRKSEFMSPVYTVLGNVVSGDNILYSDRGNFGWKGNSNSERCRWRRLAKQGYWTFPVSGYSGRLAWRPVRKRLLMRRRNNDNYTIYLCTGTILKTLYALWYARTMNGSIFCRRRMEITSLYWARITRIR